MIWIQKLVRNGSSTMLTIPRPLLFHLGWSTGELATIELLEDGTLHIRKPTIADLRRRCAPQHLPATVAAAAK